MDFLETKITEKQTAQANLGQYTPFSQSKTYLVVLFHISNTFQCMITSNACSTGLFQNDDLDLEDMETGAAPWRSPTLMKCAIVVLVTQYTVRLFERSSSRHMPFTWLDTVLPDDVILGRVLQVLLGNCFYIWRLYRAEDWQWSHWLSPGD
ncbi:hypothetical protein DPMN_014649 [Dreissena polymorpha]|uniref:Uncharacterized protein n=1 Tax=Dreissena polymorpha TaxID=45954 RepID=A0A9D4S2X1_DREPO|nr:hypothetical protein DPMN_014649 [Dreissena polymorpha]